MGTTSGQNWALPRKRRGRLFKRHLSFHHFNRERLARKLEQLGDYRVRRRLPRPDEIWCCSMPLPENVMTLGVVDCETSGLDPERNKMIELAIGKLTIDLNVGDIIDVTPPESWLQDPTEGLSIEIERLTHITADMLFGKWFPEVEVTQAFEGVDAIVAHSAKFDRAFFSLKPKV